MVSLAGASVWVRIYSGLGVSSLCLYSFFSLVFMRGNG